MCMHIHNIVTTTITTQECRLQCIHMTHIPELAVDNSLLNCLHEIMALALSLANREQTSTTEGAVACIQQSSTCKGSKSAVLSRGISLFVMLTMWKQISDHSVFCELNREEINASIITHLVMWSAVPPFHYAARVKFFSGTMGQTRQGQR